MSLLSLVVRVLSLSVTVMNDWTFLLGSFHLSLMWKVGLLLLYAVSVTNLDTGISWSTLLLLPANDGLYGKPSVTFNLAGVLMRQNIYCYESEYSFPFPDPAIC